MSGECRQDVLKRILLYNAQVRLRSRQRKITRRWRFPFKKKPLAHYGIAATFLILVYLFLPRLASYDVERYVSVFSTAIQGVTTIFALIAAGTLLLVERIGSRSPGALSFLPVIWVTGLFIFFAAITALDFLVMLALPSNSAWSWLANLVLVMNMAGIAVTVFYVRGLLTWLRPETVFKILQEKGAKTKSKEKALQIVRAIREIAVRSILDHDTMTTNLAVNVCEDLSSSFCARWKGENLGFDVWHPIRQVAYCVREIGTEAITVGMDNSGDRCVEAICMMAFHHYDNQIHTDEWIFGTATTIANELIKKGKGSGPISSLIIEAKVAADQGKLSVAHC